MIGRIVALPLLALTACANSEPVTVTEVRTATSVTTIVETVTAAAPTPAAPSSTAREFQLPSGNIGCRFHRPSRSLRCDVLTGLVPPPTGSCDFDWVGMTLDPSGAEPHCGSDVVFTPQAEVLPYGATWERGGIRCESAERGITCRNADGAGFFLSRGSWRTL